MQINKKVFTIALTALLLVSMLAIVAPAFAAVAAAAPVPATGSVGTKVGVVVSGASAGGQLQTYWENLAGAQLGNQTTYADGTGAATITVYIPYATAGVHSIIVKDVSTGATVGASGGFTVTPQITLSATSGIPGDSVVVNCTGFAGTAGATKIAANVTFNGVDITPIAAQLTSATGDVIVTISVPSIAYGPYNVVASDNASVPNTASAVVFTIGAAITLSPTNGPPGTVVTVTGRGFNHAVHDVALAITAPTVTPVANLTVMRTAADGTFTTTFVVPSIPTPAAQTVGATDGTYTATKTFTTKGVTGLTVSPTSAAPGATVTVTGSNFTAIEGTAVTVKLNAVTVATFATTASGTFTGTFTVPNLPTNQYDISAVDAKVLNKTLTNGFAIAITALFATPTSGPTGTVVTLTGFGFALTGGTTFNVTLNGKLLTPSSNTVGALAAGTSTVLVPTMAVGAFPLVVTDDMGLTASVTYTINATSTLTVNPTQVPAAVANVALTVRNFVAAVTVDFYITNSTYSAVLSTSAVVNPTNSSGIATATFTVPSIDLGAYTIVANESTGKFNATAAFTIGAATVSVSTGAASYAQGNTVSFNIQSTFPSAATITVIDPNGFPVSVTTIAATTPPWVVFGSVNAIPLNLVSFTLPSGALTGTYNWTVALTTISTTKTGQFTVSATAAAGNVTNNDLNTTLANINTKLDALGANITSIKDTLSALDAKVTSISGSIATLQTSMGTVTTSVSSLSSSISGISSGVATIQTTLGTVTASLSSIDAVLGYVAGDTATISTSVGTLNTSLASIGTTVTGISGNVATIQTDLGTLTGTVTSVTNAGIATIQTSLGTMQTNIGTLQTEVGNLQTEVTATKDSTGSLSTLIIVAIVLALVAAMAAIASIVLMRRKIAG